MEIFALDEKRGVLIADTPESGAYFAAVRFMALAKEAIKEHGQFCVALSGGSTPKKLYETLLKPQFRDHIEWKKVKLFWSDERAVAPDSPESNFGMAMKYFSTAPLNEAKVFRMEADSPNIQKAALDYENIIKKECTNGVLDLVLLGMGDDGHTASLFPGTEALQSTDRLVVANFVPEKNSWRMTFTYGLILNSKRVILLTFGKDKQRVFHEVLQGRHPAGRLGQGSAFVFFITDRDCFGTLS